MKLIPVYNDIIQYNTITDYNDIKYQFIIILILATVVYWYIFKSIYFEGHL